MWYNGSNENDNMKDINLNMNMIPTMNLNNMNMNMNMNMNSMNMNSNFHVNHLNNHDIFDFSLHSNSMQQGTESASTAISVSKILISTQIFLFSESLNSSGFINLMKKISLFYFLSQHEKTHFNQNFNWKS